ncbi:MAG: UDP-N-acetylmuramate:L-alanyl-gamma-D-glutamyl-meso-diaminopimelate ligase [Deltaproteobacteria bacterium]|nr:UDP-N-acetylmuramate:L-alanyl-gamma-D-glutamyl-meso-diaminopimelate ligase [Deltaproteobacteria bacterium]
MRIHMIAICGTGMGSLAALLQAQGHEVRGSDANVYPPMSDYLRDRGIPILEGFDATHLDPAPDLVIIGNAVRRENPEAVETMNRGLDYLSFPGALRRFFLSRKTTVAVTGTHGKTTTTALLSWIFTHAGLDPSFLIGGIARNFGQSIRLGEGEHFIIEGDEYDTAFFDKVPKFLRYAPSHAILANVEFDHADIYDNLDAVMAAFRELVRQMPPDGLLVAGVDDTNVRELIQKVGCPVVTYGVDEAADFGARNVRMDGERMRFDIVDEKGEEHPMASPINGAHNLRNILAAYAMSRHFGISPEAFRAALATFEGVARRQEERGEEAGVLVIDDFAHHPTAVRLTLAGLRERYAGRRLVTIFEPRTNTTRRRHFQEAYAKAFESSDAVIIAPVYHGDDLSAEERFDPMRLAADLKAQGIEAHATATLDETFAEALDMLQHGDLAAVLSNGGFGDMHRRLLAALAERARGIAR